MGLTILSTSVALFFGLAWTLTPRDFVQQEAITKQAQADFLQQLAGDVAYLASWSQEGNQQRKRDGQQLVQLALRDALWSQKAFPATKTIVALRQYDRQLVKKSTEYQRAMTVAFLVDGLGSWRVPS